MKYRSINSILQMRVRRYIEYMHEEEKMGNQRGEQLISMLSSNLKEELMYDAYLKKIQKIKLFKDNFSENFLKQLCLIYKECTFAPEECIFKVIDPNYI